MADMQRMQADVNQLEARRLAGYFVDAVNNAGMGGAPVELSSLLNSRITDARDRLAAWTYNTPAGFDTPGDPGAPTPQELIDSVATTIYNVAVGRLMNRTFDAKLAAAGIGYRQGTSEGLRGLIRLLTRVPFTGVGVSGINFFDDTSVALSAANERDIILVKSLQDALDLLAGAGFAHAFANSTERRRLPLGQGPLRHLQQLHRRRPERHVDPRRRRRTAFRRNPRSASRPARPRTARASRSTSPTSDSGRRRRPASRSAAAPTGAASSRWRAERSSPRT